jgi:hypothetical protein
VVLAWVSWWLGEAPSGLSTVTPKVAAAALRRGQSFSGNWGRTVGCRARASHGEACAGVDWGGGELVRTAHERAVRGRSGGRRRRGKCGSDAGKWARGVTERHVGVEVVLLRARGRRLRRCS